MCQYPSILQDKKERIRVRDPFKGLLFRVGAAVLLEVFEAHGDLHQLAFFSGVRAAVIESITEPLRFRLLKLFLVGVLQVGNTVDPVLAVDEACDKTAQNRSNDVAHSRGSSQRDGVSL